ncbi:hypothetical protein [Hymenobacter cavernae]|uniref:REase AHJR-like domain-containing protein n=1 Tax=Hymenobacter cavernae TaxID=2044852 RepID=A0ABQ1U238_9BACT|nr:hypothetical protein [Hymenobacter cavernae]GGF07474.1 hypothetical protein GCM10011383_18180 [Hymenobacter cavernae]
MSTSKQQHDARVQALASEYQRNGYQVHIEPSNTAFPFDLAGYTPDLLAEKGDEHLLIEVKNSTTPVSISRFRDLIENVKQQPGWRFILVNTLPENEPVRLPQEPLSWQDITARITQAKRLHETGESAAAILLFWPALEALLRRHAENVGLPIEHLSVRALLDYLYSEAELSFEQFEAAKKLLPHRNQLAHGFQIQDAKESAAQLQGLIDELSNEWLQTRQAS